MSQSIESQTMLTHDVTVVIPAYNEARRLPRLLAEFQPLLDSEPRLSLVIVDDGSDLDHFQAIEAIVASHVAAGRNMSLVRLPHNSGKGAALAKGFELAQTPYVGFIDADGSVSATEFMRLACYLTQDPLVDAVLASRVKMLGMKVERRLLRHLMGRVFATAVSVVFDIAVYDSQCGCKIYRRDAVMPLLPMVHSKGWLWDTQLMILLYVRGKKLIEVPVHWSEVPGSKVSLLWDPLRMLGELLLFRRHLQSHPAPPRP